LPSRIGAVPVETMSNYHHQAQDMYHDNSTSRSPGSHRHPPQQLHRQPSRQFDAYGSMPAALYTDDFAARYEAGLPERMNPALPSGGYGYDMNAAQTWNSNGLGGTHPLGNIGSMGQSASTRMKPNARTRTGLPSVRFLSLLAAFCLCTWLCRCITDLVSRSETCKLIASSPL
jgi:hypothetical protein